MSLILKNQNTKTLTIKVNGRSSDFVTPNFILGCNAGCSNSYCYTRRFNRPYIYVNQNIDEILQAINNHRLTLEPKISDQTDSKYWTYDIGCDTDIVFHWKDYDWNKVLNFFQETPDIKATFATKFCSNELSKRQVFDKKLRIRFSVMPQYLSELLEPNTSKLSTKFLYIHKFLESGWDVHINLSPIVVTETWLQDYKFLLENIKLFFPNIKFECIFLTHNEYLHNLNLLAGRINIESVLWKPEIQETKISQYGGENIRYKWQYKNELVRQFKEIFLQYFKEEQLRYIF